MDNWLQVGVSNAVIAAVLAIPAVLASKLLRKPALAHGLWLLVLIKLITPPVWTISLHWPEFKLPGLVASNKGGSEPAVADASPASPGQATGALGAVEEFPMEIPGHGGQIALDESAGGSSSQPPEPLWSFADLFPWIALLWIGGSVYWLVMAGCRIAGFHRLLHFGQRAPDRLQEQARVLAQRLGLRHCPQLWMVPGHISPLVWALGSRVRLVLPEKLLETLTPEQQDTLLVHELAHAQRRDHWVRWLELLATGIYWWHPVVWWARHEIHLAEEQCCDAWVVWALPRAARTYARALLQTVEFLDAQPALPPVASGIGHVQSLKRRLRMIVQQPPSPRLSWLVHLAIATLGLLVLPLGLQQAQAHNLVPDEPLVRMDNDDEQADPPQNQDRQMRDLDRRLRVLENRLDRVLRSLESRTGRGDATRSGEDRAGEEAERRTRSLKEEALRKAREAEEKARAKEREVKQKFEFKFREAEKKLAEQQEKLEKQAQEWKRRFDGDSKEGGSKGLNQFEWRFETDGKFNPEQLKALQQQIESAVKEAVNPERMKKMEKEIQESLNRAINPERMKQLQAQIEQSVQRNINPERLEALAKQIEASVQKSLAAEERERKRQGERARAGAGARSQSGAQTRSAPESGRRDLERRLDRLEERMNRLAEMLERQQSKERQQ
jgi:beta-lactamase regulating signal transducer with metallopeptidase domain